MEAREIIIDTKELNLADETVIHHLPFAFESWSGPARIKTHFMMKTVEARDGTPILSAAFRGRELLGKTLQLPDDYIGLIVKDGKGSMNDETDARCWEVESKFHSFNYWNLEAEPSENDRVQRWMRWIELSSAIHRPITREELEPKEVSKKETPSAPSDKEESHEEETEQKPEKREREEKEEEIEEEIEEDANIDSKKRKKDISK
eukprot:TRINITY_DN11059_c0_g1_i1.p1 TRINITY_DN11059_c0_g1~~TRINITY_DN11059_c0_g1_i1.p1  ORF type:complete len:214 (-),score=50.50 TRINITY_DN11059_c0_g1_i1:64-678(-)